MRLIPAIIVCVIFATPRAAFSAQNCSDALAKDVQFSTLSTSDKIRIALLTDKTSFDQHQQGYSGDYLGSYGKASASWTDFQQKQNAVKRDFKLEDDYKFNSYYYNATVQAAAFKAFSDCIRNNGALEAGLTLFLEYYSGDEIRVSYIYRTDDNTNVHRITISGGDNVILMAGKPIELKTGSMNTPDTITFHRLDPKKPVNISGLAEKKIGGSYVEPSSKTLDPIPPAPILLSAVTDTHDLFIRVEYNYATNKSPTLTCLAPDAQWVKPPGNPTWIKDHLPPGPVNAYSWKGFEGGPVATQTERIPDDKVPSPGQICYNVSCDPVPGHNCSFIGAITGTQIWIKGWVPATN